MRFSGSGHGARRSQDSHDISEDPADLVFECVCAIPSGKVISYGQLAEMVRGVRLTARETGRIMAMAPPGTPWHRVLAVDGSLSIHKRDPRLAQEQRRLLEEEGVVFRPNGRVDMEVYRWRN